MIEFSKLTLAPEAFGNEDADEEGFSVTVVTDFAAGACIASEGLLEVWISFLAGDVLWADDIDDTVLFTDWVTGSVTWTLVDVTKLLELSPESAPKAILFDVSFLLTPPPLDIRLFIFLSSAIVLASSAESEVTYYTNIKRTPLN